MSALLYGELTRRRMTTDQPSSLVFADAADPSNNSPVKAWIDAFAALVPAEVLAVHGFALSFGTTTTGAGTDATTKITYPGPMSVVYVALVVLTMVLVFVGAKTAKGRTIWLSASVSAFAFVGWTMIQPSTAFDALPISLTGFSRVMIAVFLAVVLALVSVGLAARSPKEHETDTGGHARAQGSKTVGAAASYGDRTSRTATAFEGDRRGLREENAVFPCGPVAETGSTPLDVRA